VKELGNKLIAQFHIIIFLYAAYTAYFLWEEHDFQYQELLVELPSIEEDIERTRKKVKEIADFKKKSEESKIRVEEVAKNIELAQRQLPSDINDTNIINYFQEEINMLNIKESTFVPGTESKSTYFIAKEYSLNAKGTFLQFLVFFERLAMASRIYNVKTLKLVSAGESNKGRFQTISTTSVIQAFRYNPEFKVDRGFEEIRPQGGGK
jgi:Tfp pilus assembly protein PilO